jgi:hypothetical protein
MDGLFTSALFLILGLSTINKYINEWLFGVLKRHWEIDTIIRMMRKQYPVTQ